MVSAAAGGFALGMRVPFDTAEAGESGPEVNAWAVIKPDETVVIRIARSEMGQGSLTGLAQMVAEELECDWSKVTYEFPTPGQNVARKRVWGDFFTAGSQGIRSSNEIVRKRRSAVRPAMMLVVGRRRPMEGAGRRVHGGEARRHRRTRATGRTITYGKIAEAANKIEPPTDIKLKDPKTWKIIGQGFKRMETPLKVDGSAIYGIDIRMPGMLYAAIKACPVNGGKVTSFDAAKVTSRKGVKQVLKVEDTAVAVVADSWWRAKTALDELPIDWDLGDNVKVSSASIAAWLKEGLDAETGLVGNKTGDAKAELAKAAKKVEAVYAYPYQHHVTLEPQNATALYTDRQVRGVDLDAERRGGARARLRGPCGLPIAKCEVYKTFLGGGFGHGARPSHDTTSSRAVLIAKQMPGNAGEAAVDRARRT